MGWRTPIHPAIFLSSSISSNILKKNKNENFTFFQSDVTLIYTNFGSRMTGPLQRGVLCNLCTCMTCLFFLVWQPVSKFTCRPVTLPWCLTHLLDFRPLNNLQLGAYNLFWRCWRTSKSTHARTHTNTHTHAKNWMLCCRFCRVKLKKIHVVGTCVVTGLWTYFTKRVDMFVSHLTQNFT